jgi:hypothetical protein
MYANHLLLERIELPADLLEGFLSHPDQIHFVNDDDNVFDPEQPRDTRVADSLRQNTFPGIQQHQGHVRSGRSGCHVPGVLLVSRCVGDNELALSRGKITIRYVDRNALFALCSEAVGEQRKIHPVSRYLADSLQLIFIYTSAVIEKPANQC